MKNIFDTPRNMLRRLPCLVLALIGGILACLNYYMGTIVTTISGMAFAAVLLWMSSAFCVVLMVVYILVFVLKPNKDKEA